MEITLTSKLFDVLEAYPELEAQISGIAPPFKNLSNPVLRRTVGKIATIEKVAQIGGMDADRLVNTLRRAVGQAELKPGVVSALKVEVPAAAGDPDWISGEPQFTLDGTGMLQRGEVPLGKVNELLATLDSKRYLLLVTDFEPAPIIEAMQKQSRAVFHKVNPRDEKQHLTFIK